MISAPKLILICLLWSIYIGLLARMLIRHRGTSEFRGAVWGLFFLACVAFTFSGLDVEQAADSAFNGLPVSIYVKYFALTYGVYLQCSLMHKAQPISAGIFRALKWLNRIALAAGGVSFILLVVFDLYNHPELRYYVSAARDFIVALYMLVILIPSNLSLFRAEAVPTMRIKLALSTLFCATYVLVALTSLISLVVVLSDLTDINVLLPVFLPLTYLVYGLFVCAIMPHRWTALVLFPVRLYIYWRLQRLRREVQRLAQIRLHFDLFPVRPSSPDELEFAIYQTVIFILDHAELMPFNADKNHLSNRLAQFLQVERSYPMLVRGLVRLTDDRPHS